MSMVDVYGQLMSMVIYGQLFWCLWYVCWFFRVETTRTMMSALEKQQHQLLSLSDQFSEQKKAVEDDTAECVQQLQQLQREHRELSQRLRDTVDQISSSCGWLSIKFCFWSWKVLCTKLYKVWSFSNKFFLKIKSLKKKKYKRRIYLYDT